MATEAQTITILNILVALYLSRVLYKSTLFMQNKPNLPDAQMNVSSILTKHYENARLRGRGENKPNQTQYKANTKPIQTQFAEMSKMNVTSILTKDYENETAFRPQKNKPKQTQFQTASASNRRIGKHQIIQFFGNPLLIINNH